MNAICNQLIDIFAAESELEQCGLITAEGEVLSVPNVHDDPKEGFRMDPATLLELMTSKEIVATWHTHPQGDAALSQEDYAGFLQWPDLVHYIIGLGDEIRGYAVEDRLVVNVGEVAEATRAI